MSGVQSGQLPSTIIICYSTIIISYRSAYGDCEEREFFVSSRVAVNAEALTEF